MRRAALRIALGPKGAAASDCHRSPAHGALWLRKQNAGPQLSRFKIGFCSHGLKMRLCAFAPPLENNQRRNQCALVFSLGAFDKGANEFAPLMRL
jgi:hypothetical protein